MWSTSLQILGTRVYTDRANYRESWCICIWIVIDRAHKWFKGYWFSKTREATSPSMGKTPHSNAYIIVLSHNRKSKYQIKLRKIQTPFSYTAVYENAWYRQAFRRLLLTNIIKILSISSRGRVTNLCYLLFPRLWHDWQGLI